MRALDAVALSRWADKWCAKLAPLLLDPGRLVLISFLSAVGEGKVVCAASAPKFTAAHMSWQELFSDLDSQVV